jgi:hypothetical protein
MKKIIYLAMSILLAGASFSFAQAEGMFTGSLPENWSADVVASVKYSRNHFSNWKDGGVNTNTWLLQYDADVNIECYLE